MSPSPEVDEASDALTDHLWKRRHRVILQARISVLYHLKRERFFDRWDKLIAMVTAAVATAAVAALLKKADTVDLTFGTATAVLSIVPLIYNPAERARKHAQQAADFKRFQSDCERAGERWTEQDCDQFMARLVELEVSDPAPLCALVIDCQNQLQSAYGEPRVRLAVYERWLKHWIEFDASRIVSRNQRETEQRALGIKESALSRLLRSL